MILGIQILRFAQNDKGDWVGFLDTFLFVKHYGGDATEQ
jgi:hypothetical protein